MQQRVFTRLFEQAEIARYTPEEQKRYYDNYKAYRDIHNAVDTARNEGREEGIAVGREEGIAVGREEGIAVGREEGAEKEKRMTARIQRILNEMNSESGSV